MVGIREMLRINIIQNLENNNMSKKQLAELLGVSQAAVSNWISGKNSPDIEIIAKMCDIFSVSVTQLMGSNEGTVENLQKKELLQNFSALNKKGRTRLIEYSADLLDSGNYLDGEK